MIQRTRVVGQRQRPSNLIGASASYQSRVETRHSHSLLECAVRAGRSMLASGAAIRRAHHRSGMLLRALKAWLEPYISSQQHSVPPHRLPSPNEQTLKNRAPRTPQTLPATKRPFGPLATATATMCCDHSYIFDGCRHIDMIASPCRTEGRTCGFNAPHFHELIPIYDFKCPKCVSWEDVTGCLEAMAAMMTVSAQRSV